MYKLIMLNKFMVKNKKENVLRVILTLIFLNMAYVYFIGLL